MGRRGPEAKIQDVVVKYAREEYGALVKKNEVGHYNTSSGWPDVVILPKRPRVPFFIEFKAPGGELTPLQKHMKKQIEDLGYKVYKVNSIAYGKLIIDQECV